MAGGSPGSFSGNLNSQQTNPFAAALKAQNGGSAPTSNPFVQSGMAAMLMAQRQPQMQGGQGPARMGMGQGAPMPQMPMPHPQMPFSGAPGQMQGGVGMPQQPPWMGQQNPMMGQQSITPSTLNPTLARQLGLMG
jgi:hypothetical protein